MALPGIPQTFAVEHAEELTEKLWWEIEAYEAEPNITWKRWRAFNCALTAWHITDWVWRERSVTKGWKVGKVEAFQNAMQNSCNALRLCRHVANASKDAGTDRNYAPSIAVIVRAKNTPAPLEEFGHSRQWEIVIADQDGEYDALTVFYQAHGVWVREVRALPPTTFE